MGYREFDCLLDRPVCRLRGVVEAASKDGFKNVKCQDSKVGLYT